MQEEQFGSKRLRVAMLLALAGGFLDAYTYYTRGGVFANAQTGNIVMLGLSFAEGSHERDLHYIISIAAFFCGIIAVLLIETHLKQRKITFVRRSILLVEILVMCAVGLVPQSDETSLWVNACISFIAAMQFEGFKTFRGEAITTTMSTGNLRKFAENLYIGIHEDNKGNLLIAGYYITIILFFAMGAVLGARCCRLFSVRAIWVGCLFLVAAVALITWIKRKE